jgi:hypothetical protein
VCFAMLNVPSSLRVFASYPTALASSSLQLPANLRISAKATKLPSMPLQLP